MTYHKRHLRCEVCGKKISRGVSLGPNRGGSGQLYIPMFQPFCTRNCLLKCVKKQIEPFDMEDW